MSAIPDKIDEWWNLIWYNVSKTIAGCDYKLKKIIIVLSQDFHWYANSLFATINCLEYANNPKCFKGLVFFWLVFRVHWSVMINSLANCIICWLLPILRLSLQIAENPVRHQSFVISLCLESHTLEIDWLIKLLVKFHFQNMQSCVTIINNLQMDIFCYNLVEKEFSEIKFLIFIIITVAPKCVFVKKNQHLLSSFILIITGTSSFSRIEKYLVMHDRSLRKV